MDTTAVLKAIADETRMKILTLLLRRNPCVRVLAENLGLSEATVSQHLKTLREAGLLVGEKRGYFMHYDVRRAALRELAGEIEALAAIERETCAAETGGCRHAGEADCHAQGACDGETKAFCHGERHGGEDRRQGACGCHRADAPRGG